MQKNLISMLLKKQNIDDTINMLFIIYFIYWGGRKMSIKTRTVTLFLSLLMISSVFCLPAYAAVEFESGDFVFSVNGSYLTLKDYKGKGGVVQVPETVAGRKVTTIGAQAFEEFYKDAGDNKATPDSERITKVILPMSVIKIEKYAFIECTKLSEISMIGVSSIGEAAFWYCKNLKKAAVSSSLRTIGLNAFGKCTSLKLYCEKNSIAEEYAKTNGVRYSALYPENLKITKSTVSVEKGKYTDLKVESIPSDVYFKEYYWDSDGVKTSVSQSGKVKGVALGNEKVRCFSIYGGASAECTVNVKIQSVTDFSKKQSKINSITLAWGESPQAYSYRLEMKKDGKWIKLSESSKRTFTVTKLNPATTYEFRVRVCVKSGSKTYTSDWKTLKASTLTPGKVKNIKAVSNSVKGLTFSWEKAANADGYEIYYINSKGEYKKLERTGDLIFSEVLSQNTVRKYSIRAIKRYNGQIFKGGFSKTFTYSTKPIKATGLNVSSKTRTSITLKWNKMKNASGYGVYSVNNGVYKLITEIKGTTYTIDGLRNDTKYTYAVRAYINTTLGRTYGDYSNSLTATPYISEKELAVNNMNSAFKNVLSGKQFYTTYEEKVTASVVSCSASGKAAEISAAIAESFNRDKKDYYDFVNGKDISGVTPSAVFAPEKGFKLKTSYIDSSVKEKDGSGYNLRILLNSEKVIGKTEPEINSSVWGKINYETVRRAIAEDAELKYFAVTYEGTVLNAKINSKGSFDNFTLTVPYTVKTVCLYNGESVETVVAGRIVRDYNLTWW